MACSLVVFSLFACIAMTDAYYYSPQYILNQHNIFRCMHGVPSLGWNQAVVANAAQSWANRIRDNMQHGGMDVGQYHLGQNLYISWNSGNVNANECVQDWYDEIKYTPGGQGAQGNFNGQTGHYTQVVWKGTQALGCGRWCGPSQGMNCCQVVCDYYPAGNMMGEFSSNVLATQKTRAQCVSEVELQGPANNATIPEELPEILFEEEPTSWMQKSMSRFEFVSFITGSMFIAIAVTAASYYMKRRSSRVEMSSTLLG